MIGITELKSADPVLVGQGAEGGGVAQEISGSECKSRMPPQQPGPPPTAGSI